MNRDVVVLTHTRKVTGSIPVGTTRSERYLPLAHNICTTSTALLSLDVGCVWRRFVGVRTYRPRMNLQSRSKRWLAAIELAKPVAAGMLLYREKNIVGKTGIPEQAQDLFVKRMLDPLRLTIESEPVPPGTPLHGVLSDVVRTVNEVQVGTQFVTSVKALDVALDAALNSLRDWTAGEDSKIEDIIDELERAFLISLFITLTSHTFVVTWGGDWETHHDRFLDGKESHDLPHYVHLPTFMPCAEPGNGRVHVQQLLSALRAGTQFFIAGASSTNVEHYPELQSIVYSQWFAYMHAIWDEQFRERIAAFYDTPEEPLEKNDVLVDFFGDIRRIRNDFVHRKGIADEVTKVKLLKWGFVQGDPLEITTEQMLSLVGLFPREALMVKPTPRPAPNRKSVPGSADIVLVDNFLAKVAEMQIDKNAAIDEALAHWIEQH
jgi:hypothetical protein